MVGTVYLINSVLGIVAIATEQDFTVIELLNDDIIEVGDVMEWTKATGLGRQVYNNKTKRKQMTVFAQNHWVSKQQLRSQLRLE